jgi:TonB family protein
MMNLANYLLQSSVCLLAWYLFYLVFLYKDTHFRFNRLFLLSAVASSIVVPALNISLPAWGSASSGSILLPNLTWLPSIMLPEIEVNANASASTFTWSQLLSYWYYLYFAGVSYFAGCLAAQLFRIYRLAKQAEVTYIEGIKVVLLRIDHPVFSFGRSVYWNEKLSLQDPEIRVILEHELAHIRQYHTADLIFLELVKIVFWFNPLMLLYKNSLREIHEFEADRQVLQHTPASTYASILLQQVFGSNILSLSHSFNQSQLKRRITMLTKNNISKGAWLKSLIALPVLGLMLYTFSCSPDYMKQDVKPMEEAAMTQEQANQKINALGEELKAIYKKHPESEMAINITKDDAGKKTMHFSTDKINNEKDRARIIKIGEEMGALMNQFPKEIATLNKEDQKKGESSSHAAVTFDNANPSDEDTFMVVEDQPSFIGGNEAMIRYLGTNINYPAEARAAKREGRVFVEFVVEKDGSIVETKVIKGMSEDLNAEAIRVVSSMPAWKPGMQKGRTVRVRMVMPIVFKLS